MSKIKPRETNGQLPQPLPGAWKDHHRLPILQPQIKCDTDVDKI